MTDEELHVMKWGGEKLTLTKSRLWAMNRDIIFDKSLETFLVRLKTVMGLG